MNKMKGLTIINTGSGKGKSTASFGLAVRAAGNNMKVIIRQFIKGKWTPGETKIFDKLSDLIDIKSLGKGFIRDLSEAEKEEIRKETICHLDSITKEIEAGKPDMVILDEIVYLLSYNLVNEETLLNFIKDKPKNLHLVMTGRGATEGLIEAADLVTEMKEVKHPFADGIEAQRGIEY
ncbi:MAG: cob(I)yrinic acid a,c-diamide adenosyltransferase [Planctomycetota bacterium]|jgi:cob(I)alamin adenosyltransferase